MDQEKLAEFLFIARKNTYAGAAGQVEAALRGSCQYEYSQDDFNYRDVYYNGKHGFVGLEGIYYKNSKAPVWGLSYVASYNGITEDEIDRILRKALVENPEARGWKAIEWKQDNYRYVCEPDFEEGNIENLAGVERIFRGTNEVYTFYYGGQILS